MSTFHLVTGRTLMATCLIFFTSMSYAACDALKTEMAKDAGDPAGRNACLPVTSQYAPPSQKDLAFLAQLALTDGGTNPYVDMLMRGTNVIVSEARATKTVIAKGSTKAELDFFKQLAGIDCIGC